MLPALRQTNRSPGLGLHDLLGHDARIGAGDHQRLGALPVAAPARAYSALWFGKTCFSKLKTRPMSSFTILLLNGASPRSGGRSEADSARAFARGAAADVKKLLLRSGQASAVLRTRQHDLGAQPAARAVATGAACRLRARHGARDDRQARAQAPACCAPRAGSSRTKGSSTRDQLGLGDARPVVLDADRHLRPPSRRSSPSRRSP